MKTLTPDGLEWIKYASTDMNIRVFNNKVNNVLDKFYPILIVIIVIIVLIVPTVMVIIVIIIVLIVLIMIIVMIIQPILIKILNFVKILILLLQ